LKHINGNLAENRKEIDWLESKTKKTIANIEKKIEEF